MNQKLSADQQNRKFYFIFSKSISPLMKSVTLAIAWAHTDFFLKPYYTGVNRLFLLKNLTIRLCLSFSKALLRALRRLISRYLLGRLLSNFLKRGNTFAIFRHSGKTCFLIQSLKLCTKNFSILREQLFKISLPIPS